MNNNQKPSIKISATTKIYDYDPDISSHPITPHLHAIPEHPENNLDKILMRFEQMLNITFRSLMMVACLSLAALIFTQVIMRYFMDSSFSGIEETSILLAVWVYFLGMGYATREREHIHGGIVSLVVKDPTKIACIRFFGTVTCMFAACFFGYFAYKYAISEIMKGRVSTTLRWPRGIWSASMIVGFTMMIGYFLLEAINQYRDILKAANRKHKAQPHQAKYKLDSQEV